MGLFKNNHQLQTEKELRSRIRFLENLCEEKDSYFTEAISDGMRHGSKLCAKHMADRKEYLKSKKK